MTNIYFVRHAQPNYENHDDLTRELTEKGMRVLRNELARLRELVTSGDVILGGLEK